VQDIQNVKHGNCFGVLLPQYLLVSQVMDKKDKEPKNIICPCCGMDGDDFVWDHSEILNDISQHLHGEEPIQLILKCHLIIENMLIDFIRLSLKEPDLIDLDRLNFPIKIQLAMSLNALPNFFPETFLYLNSLRNKVAHNLNFSLSDEHKLKFIATIPKSFNFILFPDKYKDKDFTITDFSFKELLRRYLISIDAYRARYAYHIRKKQEALENISNYLKEIDSTPT
jgi:hypothetical protein